MGENRADITTNISTENPYKLSEPSEEINLACRILFAKLFILNSCYVAERVGFEPTVGCPTLVFKTSAFVHSAISPFYKWWVLRDSNPDVVRHWLLRPARLPIPPRTHGRGSWIRTNDPLLPKQMRCQAALYPENGGKYRARTCDPHGVNVMLSQLS